MTRAAIDVADHVIEAVTFLQDCTYWSKKWWTFRMATYLALTMSLSDHDSVGVGVRPGHTQPAESVQTVLPRPELLSQVATG